MGRKEIARRAERRLIECCVSIVPAHHGRARRPTYVLAWVRKRADAAIGRAIPILRGWTKDARTLIDSGVEVRRHCDTCKNRARRPSADSYRKRLRLRSVEPRGTLPPHARMQGPCTYPMRRSWHAFEPLTWVIAPLRTPLKQICNADVESSDRLFASLILCAAAGGMSSGAVSMSEILSPCLWRSRFSRLT